MTLDDLDDDLRRLALHDVSAEHAERIRAECLKVMAARAGRRRTATPPRAYWNWLEPVAALGVSAVYLATAVRAATLLLRLR